MKRIILSLLIPISCCLTAWGQNGTVNCGQGPQELQNTDDPTKEQVGEASSSWQLSYDPNEIIGPVGYDSVRWVSINDVLNYTILFENDPEFATAAAQKVDVRFDFPNRSAQGDASLAKKAWMKGFGIGSYSFANMSFPVAKPSNAYQQRIDLRDSLGYYVDLIGGLDVARQQGFWTFSTIDPETGYAPWKSEMGLLPVNDSTHVGEGFVTFQLKPYEGLHTGDTISIQANIVFDQNDTIPTNRWCNKIDAGNPESKVSAEVVADLQSGTQGTGDLQSPSAYNLTFTANDDEGGSGVKHILLYMANHNGIYEEIDTVAVDSVLLFPVEAGKQYKLYSIAVDNTGNREPAKMEPDVILNFNAAPTDIALSDTIFQDDLAAGGYVGKLTSIDSEGEKSFAYALAEGDGAIHNDLFQITDDQLQIKTSFKCAEDSIYQVRVSTTDEGGLSFSKAFTLNLQKVLVKPVPDTLKVDICTGETCLFHGKEYNKTGFYTYTQSNDYMCDSVYVLNLSVHQPLEAPTVSVENSTTLVSSSAKNNQWFFEDGTPIEGAINQKFTPKEDGIYYVAASNGICYSAPSQAYLVKVSDKTDLQLNLKTGWNWVSSCLTEGVNQDAKPFLKPIEDITERFVGQTQELINDPVYGLTGGLTTITPTEGYKLKVTDNATPVWSGTGSKPETTTMNLHKGWNWIGYVPIGVNTLVAALADITPSENDVIKCQDDFATFSNGKWTGTLTEMKLGEGYMYYAANATSFHYPAIRAFPVTNDSRMMAPKANAGPWNYDSHQYPDNTTLIGQLFVNGNAMLEGAYSVGAFCGGECRGVGKYVDGLVFLTIHGDLSSSQQITFKAYENVTGTELPIVERITFDGQQVGNVTTPFALHTSTTTGIEDMAAGFTIYPRPLRSRMFVNGNTDNIKSIRILSTNGQTVLDAGEYESDGIDVGLLIPGVYVVAIITKDNKVCYEKVLKANN